MLNLICIKTGLYIMYIAGLYRYTEPRVAVTGFSNRVMVKLELLPGTRVLLLPLVNMSINHVCLCALPSAL